MDETGTLWGRYKLHIIALVVFLMLIGVVRFIWIHPQIIMYALLVVVGIMAYGAIYLIVKSALHSNDKSHS